MTPAFEKGLHELGTGIYAYLLPNGSWGWSNSGLIASEGKSMLVDTLMTPDLTGEMIREMRRSIPATQSFDTLVNSHADADHTWGNQLVEGAQIIATRETAEDMLLISPEDAKKMATPEMGVGGRFMEKIFDPFNLDGIELTLPTTTFAGTMSLRVGDKTVDLHQVGPAHSRGDLIVHVPDDRVVYAADLLFVGGHPAIWSGPIENWIDACNRIIDLDADVVVPGHGPLTDNDGVRQMRDYLRFVSDEGRRFHAEGLSPWDAALKIDLSAYEGWIDEERIVLAMHTIFREQDPDSGPAGMLDLFAAMGRYNDRLSSSGSR